MTIGPLMAISPSPVSDGLITLISAEENGLPAEPGFLFENGLKVTIGEVSVRPYPSSTVNPSASRLFITSVSSLAPPVVKNLNLSPRALCADLKTIRPILISNLSRSRPESL